MTSSNRVLFYLIVLIITSIDLNNSVTGNNLNDHDGKGATARPTTLQCPSDNVITTRYKCNVKGNWVDCIRKHCCRDYIFIANRCIHKDLDPCQMNLCEQKCSVYMQRIICTCFDGYKFNPDNQKKGLTPVCNDVDECTDKNGDCEHKCVNEIGSYRCECNEGYTLALDNRTCEAVSVGLQDVQAANKDKCYANCDTVTRLHEKLKFVQERVLELTTAFRLSNLAAGPPGPTGATGPPGPPGPRGFPGPEGNFDDQTTLDSFTQNAKYCRCKRGPVGPPGASGAKGVKGDSGERGLRGTKGERGSLDFLLLLLADVRHDIKHLQDKVFGEDEKPPQFDLNAVLRKHRLKEKQRSSKRNNLLEGHVSPALVGQHEHVAEFRNEEVNPFSLEQYFDYEGSSEEEDSEEFY